MDPSLMGWIGGLLGGVLGVLGGVFGTYCSLKGTRPGPERRLMIRWSVGFWVGVAIFCVAMFALPEAIRPWIWIPYVVGVVWSINRCNRGLARAREESSRVTADPRS